MRRRPAECYRRRRAGAPCRDCGRLTVDPRRCRARLDDAGLEVVGRAGDAEELMAVVAAELPDVAVIDIRMPPTHTDEGVRAAREIRRRFPGRRRARPVAVRGARVRRGAARGRRDRDRLPAEGPIADVADFGAAVHRVAAGGVGPRSGRGGADRDPCGAERAPGRRPRRHGAGDARARRGLGARAPTGVAREVGSEFVAVLPDGRHSRHARSTRRSPGSRRTARTPRAEAYSGSSPQRAGARQSDERISSRSRMNSFGSLS